MKSSKFVLCNLSLSRLQRGISFFSAFSAYSAFRFSQRTQRFLFPQRTQRFLFLSVLSVLSVSLFSAYSALPFSQRFQVAFPSASSVFICLTPPPFYPTIVPYKIGGNTCCVPWGERPYVVPSRPVPNKTGFLSEFPFSWVYGFSNPCVFQLPIRNIGLLNP